LREFGLEVITEISKLPKIMYLGSPKKIKPFNKEVLGAWN